MKIVCLSEAIAPITHMSGSSGNESIIAREPVFTHRGQAQIPFLSGNAIRHRCIRDPGIDWLMKAYDLRGTLSLAELNFLRHGGNLTESSGSENTRRIAELRQAWPLLTMLGGCLPNQILAGRLEVWRGALVCEENRDYLAAITGEQSLPQLQPAEAFIGGFQYTRGDAAKRGEAEEAEETKSNLMIFSGQTVLRGACFLHGMQLHSEDPVEIGAVLNSLALWQEQGGTIGGQASRGHGRLRCTLIAPEVDQAECIAAYQSHALANKDAALTWLRDAFTKGEPKAKKAKVKA